MTSYAFRYAHAIVKSLKSSTILNKILKVAVLNRLPLILKGVHKLHKE
jgi:hypothetical protein